MFLASWTSVWLSSRARWYADSENCALVAIKDPLNTRNAAVWLIIIVAGGLIMSSRSHVGINLKLSAP